MRRQLVVFVACSIIGLLLQACTPPPCSPQGRPGVLSNIPIPQLPEDPGSPTQQQVLVIAHGSLSRDGRFVTFLGSGALKIPYLFGDDGWIVAPASRPFVLDRSTGETTMIPGVDDGYSSRSDFLFPVISDDGRFVAFTSNSITAPPPDSGPYRDLDVMVHDRDAGVSELISVGTDGEPSNGDSKGVAISGDGRYIAFESTADNLVPGDTNQSNDVFVRDRVAGTTNRVSVASDGAQANGSSGGASISRDGRYIAFSSNARNLVPGDVNNTYATDVFVHDTATGTTTKVSVASDGTQAIGSSHTPSISDDGRYIAFASLAPNLVPDDTNQSGDVFVHDRETGTTNRVSVASDGTAGNDGSFNPAITGDGSQVTFQSSAGNLVSCDNNDRNDVFVHDRDTGSTAMVSVGPNGQSGDDGSVQPRTNRDGRYVIFDSYATNLLPVNWSDRPAVLLHDRGD